MNTNRIVKTAIAIALTGVLSACLPNDDSDAEAPADDTSTYEAPADQGPADEAPEEELPEEEAPEDEAPADELPEEEAPEEETTP